jgi:thiol-disulfide isomerase/thioredoxin
MLGTMRIPERRYDMPKRPVLRWLPSLLIVLATVTVAASELDTYLNVPAAPPLRPHDLSGQPHSLSDYRGKVILVNFWASWCGPCIEEIPSLRGLHQKMAGLPFEIVAVNVKEGRFKVHKFSRLVKMPFPVLLDPDGAAFGAWGAQVLPTSFLVDPEGRIRYRVQGPLDWTSEDVLNTIRGLLPKTTAPVGSISTGGETRVTETDVISGSPAD